MRTVKMNVNGRVQGVGFRYLTKMAADEQQITGSVKNEDDGSVTILAQGTAPQIEHFIETVKASPSPMGKVRQFSVSDVTTATLFDSFDVLY